MTSVGRILIEIERQSKGRKSAAYELSVGLRDGMYRTGALVKDFPGDHFLQLAITDADGDTAHVFVPHDAVVSIMPVWLP